jgi:LacI family transcriptional regulator
MATIKDIAHAVGVSCTTVSNVINGKAGRVSAETISRINEAIDNLGYVPNMSARSLVSNSSKVIGIINHLVPSSNKSFVEDPFHSAFIGAIEHRLRQNGYYLMLRTVEDSNDLISFLRNWNVDGMFYTGIFQDEFFQTLSKFDIPVVLIDSYIKQSNIYNVGLEDYKGGYLATKHLIDHGHKNIIFASPTIKHGGVVEERLKGYQQALSESNIPFREELVCQQEIHVENGIELGKSLSTRNDFTAVFATADILAAGIMAGLQHNGKKVPDDVSVIGFDDINLCQLTTPALTTIHQDAYLKGELAVDFMIKRLEGVAIKEREVILPVSLINRDSVKNIG